MKRVLRIAALPAAAAIVALVAALFLGTASKGTASPFAGKWCSGQKVVFFPGGPAGEARLAAAGLAAAAIGCGLAAGPLRLALLRETAALLTVAAGLVLAYGIPAGLTALAWSATVAGLAAGGIVLVLWLRPAAPAWVRPALLVSIAAAGVALGAGLAAWPDRTLLVPAFVLVAVVIVALTVSLHRPAMVAATPLPLCAAWLAYASEAMTGQPQWFTVPVGAALLAVSVLLRSVRRAGGGPLAAPDVIALEVTGMVLIMGASLVQCVTRGPFYGLIGVGLGLVLAGWGALTRVRRRLAGGTIAFLVSLLLVIAVPLVPLVPRGGGAVGWLALAGAGLVAIVAAAMLDATRGAVRRGVTRLRDLTRDWE